MTEKAHKEHINRHKMAHMVGVAEYMRWRATDYGLDKDKMYVLGLLHDIGYLRGRSGHEEYGASLLRDMGLEERYVNAIKLHGKNPYEIKEVTPEAVLLLEADMSVEKDGYRVGFEKRLKDIKDRYGEGIELKTATASVNFVKEYIEIHKINPPKFRERG